MLFGLPGALFCSVTVSVEVAKPVIDAGARPIVGACSVAQAGAARSPAMTNAARRRRFMDGRITRLA